MGAALLSGHLAGFLIYYRAGKTLASVPIGTVLPNTAVPQNRVEMAPQSLFCGTACYTGIAVHTINTTRLAKFRVPHTRTSTNTKFSSSRAKYAKFSTDRISTCGHI